LTVMTPHPSDRLPLSLVRNGGKGVGGIGGFPATVNPV
jgi:hypothetical protein